MRRLLMLPSIGAFALVAVVLASCSPAASKEPDKTKGGLMPLGQDAKEQLDEQRLIAATTGLSFDSGLVTVTVRRPSDRTKSVAAAKVANTSLNTENTWFKAVGLFRDAVLLDPTYAVPYEGMARAFLLEGKLSQAEAALRTAINRDPAFGQARFELGMVTQKKGDDAGAVTVWKDLVARDPSYPDAYARMSVASYFAQDYKSAWIYLAEADKRKQNVPPQFRGLLKEVSLRP